MAYVSLHEWHTPRHLQEKQGILTPDWGADCAKNIPDTTGFE
jgi:hypothetical protein